MKELLTKIQNMYSCSYRVKRLQSPPLWKKFLVVRLLQTTLGKMASKNDLSSNDSATAFALLSKRTLHKEEALQHFIKLTNLVESDDEANSSCPIFNQLKNPDGYSTTKEAKNFGAQEFEQL